MSRLNKADEIIELAILMQNSYLGLTVDDIAQKFECSRRSAERMKAVLFEKFSDKIETVPNSTDRKKRWRFKKGTMNFLINFSDNDFSNLEYCKNLIKNSTKQKEIEELIEKIKALNPNNNHENDIEALMEQRGFIINPQYRENIKSEILNLINEAILAQKQIKIIYKNRENIINPYGVIISDKQYLVAYNEHFEQILTYRISKIKEIELLETYFEKPDNFNLKDFMNNSFGIFQGEIFNVVLEFDKSAADDVIEYYFHLTQKIKQMKNGNIKVEFSASSSFEIITELLKWRDTVKIISPKKLKTEYIKTVDKMYQKTQTCC